MTAYKGYNTDFNNPIYNYDINLDNPLILSNRILTSKGVGQGGLKYPFENLYGDLMEKLQLAPELPLTGGGQSELDQTSTDLSALDNLPISGDLSDELKFKDVNYNPEDYDKSDKQQLAASIATQGFNLLDLTLVDGNSSNNFSGSSKAIDSAVHGVSSALIKSKNPYAMVAGVALEGANFASKAGGSSIDGFDAGINSSGYGSVGSYNTRSKRSFLGLEDITGTRMDKLLADRNKYAQMALNARNINDEIKFELEARANSIQDVLYQNKIALQGGVDTSLLSAKNGGTIKPKFKVVEYTPVSKITKAQNGAKLVQVEVSDTANVIPEGSLHKNKHDDFGIDVTKKGIPVITVKDDSAETLTDIQEQSDTVVQHAEIEESEIIFSKELTDFLEKNRAKWNQDKDDDILLEVGKRITKEIIENTDDNSGLINDLNNDK